MLVDIRAAIYEASFAQLERGLISVARSVELAISTGVISRAMLSYVHNARIPDFEIDKLRVRYPFLFESTESKAADFVLVMDANIIVSPRLIEILLLSFTDASIFYAGAKILPVRHEMDFDPVSGEIGEIDLRCAMVRGAFFDETCMPGSGRKIFQPAAIAFQDQRFEG